MDRKAFGVFVGLFNKMNGTKYSVKEALKTQSLVLLFDQTVETMKVHTDVFISQEAEAAPTDSTRRRSLDLVDLPKTRKLVLDFIVENPGCSRRQIADGTNLLMSSVCARTRELIVDGLIYVNGEVFDELTERQVETLAPFLTEAA